MNQSINNNFNDFTRFILENEILKNKLIMIKNYDLFIKGLVNISNSNNFNLTEKQIETQYRNKELKWIERCLKIY